MNKLVSLVPLCFVLITAGCNSFMQKDCKKPHKTDVIAEDTEPDRSSNEEKAPPKRSGYLAGGSTVTVSTGEEDKKISVLEQLEQAKADLASSKAKIASLEEELANSKKCGVSLEAALEETKKQLETAQQTIIEGERIRKQLNESLEPHEKKIRELTLELTKTQIEETKAKQELIGLRIEQLSKKKKLQALDAQ